MILCQCCSRMIEVAPIETRFGVIETPWGRCRRCWGRVPPALRRLFARTLRGYRAWPSFSRALELYRVWLLAIGERLEPDRLAWENEAAARSIARVA